LVAEYQYLATNCMPGRRTPRVSVWTPSRRKPSSWTLMPPSR